MGSEGDRHRQANSRVAYALVDHVVTWHTDTDMNIDMNMVCLGRTGMRSPMSGAKNNYTRQLFVCKRNIKKIKQQHGTRLYRGGSPRRKD